MPFTPALKSIAEVARQVTPFLAMSEIQAPPSEWKVAGHLGNVRIDGVNDEPFVIEGGTIVAISARTEARFVNRLTICTGGEGNQSITYTQDEVDRGVEDVAAPGSIRTTTGATADARPDNLPIGMAPYPYYRGILGDIYNNYELQPHVAVWNQAYVEYPLTLNAQDTGADLITRGGLVRSNANGVLILWDNAADSVDQIVGRCWKRYTIADDVALRGLDKVQTVSGLNLSGTGTSGVPAHLAQSFEGGGNATEAFRVVIDCAV
jgi:hypothetical protein